MRFFGEIFGGGAELGKANGAIRSGRVALWHKGNPKPRSGGAGQPFEGFRRGVDAPALQARRLAANDAIYFADAVHPEYQSRPTHDWIKRGQ